MVTTIKHAFNRTIYRLWFIVIILAMGGCGTYSEYSAQDYVGLQEYQHRQKLKQITGVDPVYTEWCAAFLNAMLKLDGVPNLYDLDHEHPLLARSFLQWGLPVAKEDIRRGDIVVFERGNSEWQGHVGYYMQTTSDGNWLILGGNQDNSVKYSIYNPYKALGVRRWPKGTQINGTKYPS